MPRKHTLSRPLGLVAPLSLALLTSCGGGEARPAFVKPALSRLELPAYPVIPEPSTPCAYDATRMCLTDEQTSGVIAAYDAAFTVARDRLEWLADWFRALP